MTPRDEAKPDIHGELGERLTRALRTEASTVTPRGDGLGLIRERVAGSSGMPRWWRPVAGLAAAAAAVTVGAIILTDSPRETSTVAESPAATSSASSGQPSGDPTPGAGETVSGQDPTGQGGGRTPEAAPRSTVTVPVYYLHDDSTGLGLYREYHRAPQLADGRAATAVQQMLSTPALDPDYTSLWSPRTRVLSYRRDGDVATVNLSADALTGAPAGSAAAALSLQQLVFTVTAAEEDSALRVSLTVEGDTVGELWGTVEADQPLARAPQLDVLGQTWLLNPAQGATVASPVDLTVYGTAFEGHTVLRVFRIGSATPVVDTFVTTAMGEFAEATQAVELPAGDYVVRAYTEYGEEMKLVEHDSKEFTVE